MIKTATKEEPAYMAAILAENGQTTPENGVIQKSRRYDLGAGASDLYPWPAGMSPTRMKAIFAESKGKGRGRNGK
ncbi:MAG: hypothetical protein HXX20_02115 [Chloroflexi bacterium]|nr:hypothetical protein [Chloroflexota bacterium]